MHGATIKILKLYIFRLQLYELHGGLLPHLVCKLFLIYKTKFKKKESPPYA